MEDQIIGGSSAVVDDNAKAFDALRSVIDPEIGMNIVELGLVYDVSVKSEYVLVNLTMTTQGCPMHESICDAARRALQLAFPGLEITVHLVWEPAWSPDRMSASARERLGY